MFFNFQNDSDHPKKPDKGAISVEPISWEDLHIFFEEYAQKTIRERKGDHPKKPDQKGHPKKPDQKGISTEPWNFLEEYAQKDMKERKEKEMASMKDISLTVA